MTPQPPDHADYERPLTTAPEFDDAMASSFIPVTRAPKGRCLFWCHNKKGGWLHILLLSTISIGLVIGAMLIYGKSGAEPHATAASVDMDMDLP